MSDWLMVGVYPENELQREQMYHLIQETMDDEGVQGSVIVSWVVSDVLEKIGICRLPAIVIDEQVVLQGRVPTREDVVGWIERFVTQEGLVPKNSPERVDWPSSLDEAVSWIIEGMAEKEKLDFVDSDEEGFSLNIEWLGGWGQGVRNGYGLWAGNRELLRDCGSDNPDEASAIILHAVRDRLKQMMGK